MGECGIVSKKNKGSVVMHEKEVCLSVGWMDSLSCSAKRSLIRLLARRERDLALARQVIFQSLLCRTCSSFVCPSSCHRIYSASLVNNTTRVIRLEQSLQGLRVLLFQSTLPSVLLGRLMTPNVFCWPVFLL